MQPRQVLTPQIGIAMCLFALLCRCEPAQAQPGAPLPVSGRAVPELIPFDDAMQQYMRERHISGGTLAVSKDGVILLQRGYGWADQQKHSLLGPQAVLRLASIGKPITLAAILRLIRAGKLNLDARVFDLLSLQPRPGKKLDPRWRDITIKHLIDHKGGWDRAAAFDPMFRPLEIAKTLGRPAPATSRDVIDYMLEQPLQHDPGSKYAYSNFGYCLLGRVIEKVTGRSYIDHVRADIFTPLGAHSFAVGRTLPQLRSPREPVYLDPGKGRNVMEPANKAQVPNPDGTFHLEAMDAHGGLIASAPDMVRFLDAYWIGGEPRKVGERKSYAFFGSLPGTWTMALQRPDGVSVVALFNQRTDASGLPYEAIREVLNAAADRVKTWPSGQTK